MKPILEIKNISKKFKIKHEQQSYLSLRDSFTNLFTRKNSGDEEFWALNDVSFDIYPGDSVGIIGRNGAGKSTLLKVLSKITPPTSGKIISRGRIASLLEVGTGFHPELSGRENVYLNGSILGLKRAEIKKQFDAIVDFSGVEKFLDTPLKHYSSGMQLRLAFAVAAHLEPEILIIDEVLAVGDVEFQRKCIRKMDEVSKDGRTFLFVSHNMGVLQQLCAKAYWLDKGSIRGSGETSTVINSFLNNQVHVNSFINKEDRTKKNYIEELKIVNENNEIIGHWGHKNKFKISITVLLNEFVNGLRIGFAVLDKNKRRVFTSEREILYASADTITYEVTVPESILVPGYYSLFVALHIPNIAAVDIQDDVLQFEVIDQGNDMSIYEGTDIGNVFVNCDWKVL